MSDPREREIDRLEQLLAESDDPQERREIQRDIRDVEIDMAEESAWYDEGFDRGYL